MRGTRSFWGLLAVALALAAPAAAEGWRVGSAGVFGGPSVGGREDYGQIEALVNVETPLAFERAGLRASIELQLSAGGIWSGNESAFTGSFGPILRLTHAKLPLYIDGSSRPTVVTDPRLGDEDLGGEFQFTSHVAVGLVLGSNGRVRLGYRFQHISNAGIYSENPGLNVHGPVVEIRF